MHTLANLLLSLLIAAPSALVLTVFFMWADRAADRRRNRKERL